MFVKQRFSDQDESLLRSFGLTPRGNHRYAVTKQNTTQTNEETYGRETENKHKERDMQWLYAVREAPRATPQSGWARGEAAQDGTGRCSLGGWLCGLL